MGIFANPLTDLLEYEDFSRDFLKGTDPVGMTGCIDSEKVHFMSTFLGEKKVQLVVTYNEQRAREIEEDYKLFCSQVYVIPPRDLIFFSADLQGNAIIAERMKAFAALYQNEAKVIITTMDALMSAAVPFEQLMSHVIKLKEGDELDLEKLKHDLTVMGYERVGRVEEPGQFTVHGGIADVYPLTMEVPVRIELWGDEIDTIRCFEPQSQRSMDQIECVSVFPAAEVIADDTARRRAVGMIQNELESQLAVFKKAKEPDKAKRLREETNRILEALGEDVVLEAPDSYISYFYPRTVQLSEYFDEKNTLVFLDEPMRLKERGDGVQAEFEESMKNRLEQGFLLPGQTALLTPAKHVLAAFERGQVAALSSLDSRLADFTVVNSYAVNVQNMNTYREGFELLIKDLTHWKKEKYRIVLLCPSRTRANRIVNQLIEYDLLAYYSEDEDKKINPGEIMVTYGNLHRGFLYPMLKFAVITESDIFGVKKKKKEKKSHYQGQRISDLKPGDYVVHENYGLGIYRGTERQIVDKVTKDYIKIEYGDGGKLYFPVTQLHMIQKYADSESKQPKLNKLNGQEWTKTKSRVQKAVNNIAKELVELYAVRQSGHGYQYGTDTVWQKEFEELVPFDETADQLAAIDATKADMESTKIMDRLVCGDVGYGKTEIAIRAAFKAVQDSKQVVFLVPTTILAQQHYNTFVERMKDYPIRIELLSRFRTSAQIKASLERLKKGLADIVIGTHRVLSKDVVFKDLGLLIIDEEQRFGVTHKEKIKQMKQNIDVLTLTATPIPRTLHMSLIGIRDMSVLEEAPQDRTPIQTYVMEYNDEMVREAISRELARGGQVYYVYNRVNNIEEITNQIRKLVPEASVAFAHGQMSERELEKIMYGFINGEIDVLVSTTIIETGLDISNANTMIIHDADQMGLSQLYQLRGRVGRSNRTAYAFLMYRRNKMLKEIAEKRLHAIREFTELGSGIKIAMRDLELRGAGNLLGAEQHGHMEAVGYDLYCKMLNEAVQEAKGIEVQEDFETTIDLQINAYIPEKYIPNEYQKLDIYKRIAAIENREEYEDMMEELLDRFGEPPKMVQNLLAVASLKAMAHRIYLTEVKQLDDSLKLTMYERAKINTAKIPEILNQYPEELQFKVETNPYFLYRPRNRKAKEAVPMQEKATELLTVMQCLV